MQQQAHGQALGSSELYSLLLVLELKVKEQEGSCHAKSLSSKRLIYDVENHRLLCKLYVRVGFFRYIQLQSMFSCEKRPSVGISNNLLCIIFNILLQENIFNS